MNIVSGFEGIGLTESDEGIVFLKRNFEEPKVLLEEGRKNIRLIFVKFDDVNNALKSATLGKPLLNSLRLIILLTHRKLKP